MTPMPTVTERQALCAAQVTLNGKPARVNGYNRDFATVTCKSSGLSAEWSWQTVALIIGSRNGAFKS